MELHLSCTNPLIWALQWYQLVLSFKWKATLFEWTGRLLYLSFFCQTFYNIDLFVFTVGNNNGPAQQWMLIDKIIQQVILQNKEGDPDVAPLELDVKKIIKQ